MTAFDFAEFLDLADELAARNDEVAWRAAVSRAYYAVLHVAYRALPARVRATISNRTTHGVTWQLYTASSASTCRQIGHAGLRLQRARVSADYRELPAVSSLQAARDVALARQTIERLRQHGYQP
ncbi:MAG: hypothetical protein U0893_15790 [Chloroflexota bacterium]